MGLNQVLGLIIFTLFELQKSDTSYNTASAMLWAEGDFFNLVRLSKILVGYVFAYLRSTFRSNKFLTRLCNLSKLKASNNVYQIVSYAFFAMRGIVLNMTVNTLISC